MPQPPPISPEDRAKALAKAAQTRRERAELKEKLKMGSFTLSELFDQADDETIKKMKMLAVLQSLPGLGKVKAKRTMEEIGIAENRKVGGLGANQRKALLDRLGS